MENNKKHSLMWLAFPVVGLAIAVSYFFALRNDFDAEIGHFATGSVPFLILTVLSVLCCLCSVVLFFMFRSKYVVAAKPKQTPLSIFGIVLCVIMCIGILIGETGILSGFKDVNIPAAISAALTPGIAALLVLCYLSSQKDENRTKNDLFAVVMGILAIISVILKMFAEYFDFSKPINGHVKILTMVMQAFVLLFLVSETRLCFRLLSVARKLGQLRPGSRRDRVLNLLQRRREPEPLGNEAGTVRSDRHHCNRPAALGIRHNRRQTR